MLTLIFSISPAKCDENHVHRRPDLPMRAGKGYFLNNKYVSDEHLDRIFGISNTNVMKFDDNVDPDVLHNYKKSRKKLRVIGHATEREHSYSCCVDSTAECLSCQQGVTLDAYCQSFPFVTGCGPELIMLYENEVCYEYCPRGPQVNYPDKCAPGLTCAPLGIDVGNGGGCGLHAYTCQRSHPKEAEQHRAAVADHMLTQFVLGDEWISDEIEIMLSEMNICEKIDYKVKLDPDQCNLQHKYLYKIKGCCDKEPPPADDEVDVPLLYVLIGGGVCCCFMTLAAVAGCLDMRRRRTATTEAMIQRRQRFMDFDDDESNVLREFWRRKDEKAENERMRKARYEELYDKLHASELRYPLLPHEIL